MSVWTDVFLGIIALATLATAITQIAVLVAVGRMAKRVAEAVEQFEQDVKPLIGHLNAIGRDATRAASLATAQVERVDRLFGEVAVRVEQTLTSVQATIGAPAREGRALLSAFRAAMETILKPRQHPRTRPGRGEDEDALFI